MGIIPHINQVRWWDKDDMNSRIKGLDLLCERCKPWIFNLPEVGWDDFWVIPMTVEGFMGTLYYGTYSKDEVREIYESKGMGLI